MKRLAFSLPFSRPFLRCVIRRLDEHAEHVDRMLFLIDIVLNPIPVDS
jgi:hypothetical protein